MQTECDDVWRQMALAKLGKGGAPDDTGDFGFIGPWREVMKLCQDVVLSDYKVWPEAGGFMDQTEEFRADFRTFMKGLAKHMHAVQLEYGGKETVGGADEDYEVPSWTELDNY